MSEPEVMSEAERQLLVCNACRYCEGFCAVFPEASARTAFSTGDITYLANLCHDCRNCYDACMFVPPHEYSINLPKILSEVRIKTYEDYSPPRALSRAFKRSGWPSLAIAIAVVLLVLGGLAARYGAGGVAAAYRGEGAFYRIVAYPLLVIPALALTLWGLVSVVAGGRQFVLDTHGSTGRPFSLRAWLGALWDAMVLKYLEGGGVGCYYPAKRGSSERRVMHMFVFWGFILDFVSTLLAFVYQDILKIVPPFPIVSAPVLIGIAGGILLVVGSTGLLVAKRRTDPVPTSPGMMAMDYIFIASLDLVALTGLLTVAFRGTAALPILFAIHLGAIAAFFASAPYGKFVHFVYRYLALVKMHADRKAEA